MVLSRYAWGIQIRETAGARSRERPFLELRKYCCATRLKRSSRLETVTFDVNSFTDSDFKANHSMQSLFDGDKDFERLKKLGVSPYFYQHLGRVWPLREAAHRLVKELSNKNSLFFRTAQERKRGTLLDFVCSQKERHKNKVILVRVGDFYEVFGLDALLVVQHCGLNAMGGKARAGCPVKNVQQTLDGLTSAGQETQSRRCRIFHRQMQAHRGRACRRQQREAAPSLGVGDAVPLQHSFLPAVRARLP